MLKVSVEVGPFRPVVKEVKYCRQADWDTMRRQPTRGANFEGRELFKGKVTRAMKKHVLTKTIKNNGRPAWMRGKIMAALRKKKLLWLRARRGGGRKLQEYKIQERIVKNMVKRAKRQLEKKLAKGGSKNKKPIYAYVKIKTRSCQGVGPLKTDDGRTVTDDMEMAEVLNKFFSSVFPERTSHRSLRPRRKNQYP